MKILVDKELVEDALERMIWIANQGSPRKPGDGSDFDRVITILQNFLDADAVDENTEDSINQQVSDSAYVFMNEPSCLVTKVEDGQVTVTGKNIDTRASWTTVQGNTPYDITDDDRRWADQAIEKHLEKHDDSQIPVRSTKANIQAIKDELALKPDPRCDGCEFQHPYAENLSYDMAAGKVFCNRGVNPIYYKEGRAIKYPPNLMICHMYYLNNGELAKFGTEWNPPCAQYCIPEMEKIMEREVDNHLAIIEILNILDSSSCSRGWDRTTELRNKVKALKAKIIKGEEII